MLKQKYNLNRHYQNKDLEITLIHLFQIHPISHNNIILALFHFLHDIKFSYLLYISLKVIDQKYKSE